MRRRLAAAAVLLLFLATACSPREAIWLNFGHAGSGGSPALHAQATRIASCETGGTFNPGAVSPTNDHGLFQINSTYHRLAFTAVTGQPWAQVYDPFWNAVYAKHLYDRLGWQPWTCRSAL